MPQLGPASGKAAEVRQVIWSDSLSGNALKKFFGRDSVGGLKSSDNQRPDVDGFTENALF